MPTITALYRISSNEVVKVSLKAQTFNDRDPAVWGVLTDPTTPDGTAVREDIDGVLGSWRQLGFAKIAEPGSNNVRNASQLEIDTFAVIETEDENQLDADQAQALFGTHPQFRKLLTAFADILRDEINILRAREVQFQDDVAAVSNLSQLQTAVAAYPVLNPRTMAQLKAAILSRISKDD